MKPFPSVDELIQLAQADPQALEAIRQREIEATIASAPSHMRNRLRGLQFQIDCKRQLHRTPMGACIAISGMMFDSLQQLNQALHGTKEPAEPEHSAQVVTFPAAPKRSLHV